MVLRGRLERAKFSSPPVRRRNQQPAALDANREIAGDGCLVLGHWRGEIKLLVAAERTLGKRYNVRLHFFSTRGFPVSVSIMLDNLIQFVALLTSPNCVTAGCIHSVNDILLNVLRKSTTQIPSECSRI